ncbi:MAG: hypothetical protein ACOVMG_07890 [Flavobacterium sp.]
MKKIVILISLLSLFSCEDKPVLLPQVDHTILAKIEDHSPIYMFFKTEKKDTLIDVNRKNSISSTNWIFNIDKRLPLRLVVPEVIKLQAKKEGSAHKSAASENYFSYSDSIQKQLAFIPFTKLTFTLEQPKYGVNIYFAKNSTVFVNAIEVEKEDLKTYLSHLPSDKPLKFNYCFDKNSSYGSFVKELVLAKTNGLQVESVFVY